MADGFLSRWSKRKAGQGLEPEPAKTEVEAEIQPSPPQTEAPPPVTLEDVEKIDRFAPDFSAFMRPDVDPAVQQAALKKMFSDPHFNVMDGLDIYIDDYSNPEPLQPEMLKRLVQSDLLGVFKSSEEVVSASEQSLDLAQAPEKLPDAEASSKTDLTSDQSLEHTKENKA